jgi:hypothetical protein
MTHSLPLPFTLFITIITLIILVIVLLLIINAAIVIIPITKLVDVSIEIAFAIVNSIDLHLITEKQKKHSCGC